MRESLCLSGCARHSSKFSINKRGGNGAKTYLLSEPCTVR